VSTTPRLLRALGPLAVVVDVEPGTAGRLAAVLRDLDLPEGCEIVAGAESVVVRYERLDDAAVVRQRIVALPGGAVPDAAARGRLVEVPVTYDGDDLEPVAAATGRSVDELIERHGAPTYLVDFMGFAPGFGYLTGLDPVLEVPRRATPRPVVPAGAVAIAARFTAIYPSASPGGWHLLGRTDLTMWDPDRAEPSLLQPGDRVRFVPS
jgi:KipI family sensor histidine kinase inhibitor